jgi:hypothetical protein
MSDTQYTSARAKIMDLLEQAKDVMLTELTIDGKTFDDAELADASAEECFEEMREKFSMLVQAIDYYAD